MAEPCDTRSVSDLISHGLSQISALFRSEIEMAKAEMSKKVTTAMGALVLIVVGAVFGIATVVMLLVTIAAALQAAGLGPVFATLLATIAGGAVAAILASIGIGRLKTVTPAPERTMRQVPMDAAALKGERT